MQVNLKSKLLFLTLIPTAIILILSLGRVHYNLEVKKDR